MIGRVSTVTLDELRRDPSAFIARVDAGEHVVLERDGRPVADVQPVPPPRTTPRPYGLAAGEFTVPDDFDDPLPPEFRRQFE